MEFTFDLEAILIGFSQGNPLTAAFSLFINGGWVIYVIMSGYAAWWYWLYNKQVKWFLTNKFVLLAIDIPKDTEQTPKAVEQLFYTISGAHMPLSWKEKNLQGKFQLSFSFEIVSIDGYVQFLIRTPSQWRDLIESAIYSQYPDAEITEVEDYVSTVPDHYPNDTRNLWGTEVIPVASSVFPIRTYVDFEDKVSGEYKDSLASILETLSKIQIGEQVWLQILIKPTGFDWVKKSLSKAQELAGKKKPKKEGFFSGILSSIFGIFFLSSGEPFFIPSDAPSKDAKKKEENAMPSMMLHLTPGERASIEAIERKASKMGFECKIRLIYSAPHEQYAISRVISSVFGSLKQFADLTSNSFKPDSKTKTQIEYLFIEMRKNWRRNKIIKAYKKRSTTIGHHTFILNTEELATIWHFPSKYIKTPLLQKTEIKKAEAPATLPIGIEKAMQTQDTRDQLRQQLSNRHYDFDLNDKHFEARFGKEKISSSIHGEPPKNLPTE